MNKITAIGEILIDLTQTGKDEQGIPNLAANPGGAPANVAVAAAKLGADAAFIGCVGQDAFGGLLRHTLQKYGVETSGLAVSEEVPTTLAVVTVEESGEREFQFYRSPGADLCLSKEMISLSQLDETEMLHFGSVSLTGEPSRSAVLYAVRYAKQQGKRITYDPNYRAGLWENQEIAVEHMRSVLPMVDIIKLSDEETELLTGFSDPEEAAAALEQQGISLILITLGAKGVFCRWQGTNIAVPGFSVPVADTNGAGDTFFGAVLSRLAQRESVMKDLTIEELGEILVFANRAAAVTVSRHGAIPAMPVLGEIQEI